MYFMVADRGSILLYPWMLVFPQITPWRIYFLRQPCHNWMEDSLESLASTNYSLKQQLKNAEEGFKEYMQIALYSNIQVTQAIFPQLQLFNHKGDPVFLYLDAPCNDPQIFEKLYYALIMRFSNLPDNQNYSIVTVDRKGDLEVYRNLVNLLRLVPLRYLSGLRIVLVGKKIIAKDQLGKGVFDNYISMITTCLSSIDALKSAQLTNVITALKKQGIQNLNPASSKVMQFNHRNNLVDQNRQRETIDLNKLIQDKRHPTLSSYETVDDVPKVLITLLNSLEDKLDTVGLFRRSPSIEEEKDYLPALQYEDYGILAGITNPHVLASLAKKIFSFLQPPIFSYQLYEFITLEEFQGQSGLYLILSMIHKLPESNFKSLKYLSGFLNSKLLKNPQNKMTAKSLAIILAPILLRSYSPSYDDMRHINKTAGIVENLIENYQFLFRDHKEQGFKDELKQGLNEGLKEGQNEGQNEGLNEGFKEEQNKHNQEESIVKEEQRQPAEDKIKEEMKEDVDEQVKKEVQQEVEEEKKEEEMQEKPTLEESQFIQRNLIDRSQLDQSETKSMNEDQLSNFIDKSVSVSLSDYPIGSPDKSSLNQNFDFPGEPSFTLIKSASDKPNPQPPNKKSNFSTQQSSNLPHTAPQQYSSKDPHSNDEEELLEQTSSDFEQLQADI